MLFSVITFVLFTNAKPLTLYNCATVAPACTNYGQTCNDVRGRACGMICLKSTGKCGKPYQGSVGTICSTSSECGSEYSVSQFYTFKLSCVSGRCRKPNYAPCSGDSQCQSSYCSDCVASQTEGSFFCMDRNGLISQGQTCYNTGPTGMDFSLCPTICKDGWKCYRDSGAVQYAYCH